MNILGYIGLAILGLMFASVFGSGSSSGSVNNCNDDWLYDDDLLKYIENNNRWVGVDDNNWYY